MDIFSANDATTSNFTDSLSIDVPDFLLDNLLNLNYTPESNTPICSDDTTAEPQVKSKKNRGGWPKGRKRKPEMLHLPPKAPSTGYNLYLNDQRKLFKESNLPFHEITKVIGNRWSSLSLSEKTPYLEKAEEEKRRYREEFRTYRQSGAYQLYLANKRRKRAIDNILSESDMDATDDLDDEDNEELYCRTCDQWFHNLHNKREHLLGRQHTKAIAGAITSELESDYDTDGQGFALLGNVTSSISMSTSLDESSMDASVNLNTANTLMESQSTVVVANVTESIENLMTVIGKRESEIKTLQSSLEKVTEINESLLKLCSQLKEREAHLNRVIKNLKKDEKALDTTVFNLWQLPSLFVINIV